MLIKEFIDSGISYKVHEGDMPQFLNECKDHGLKWWFQQVDDVSMFDPFTFYKGTGMAYLKPIMQIDDESYVYIKCFNGLLYWSFHYDWQFQPFKVYGKE